MRKYIISMVILIVMISLLLAVSLLLDLEFIKAKIVRQLIIYALMILIVLIGFKIDKNYNT